MLLTFRRKGGGRRRHDVTHSGLVPALEKLVDPATRGDPESPLRWTCKSTHVLSDEMFVWSRRTQVEIGDGVHAAIPCLDDLILTKRFGERPRDADDIRWLEQLKARP